MRFLRKALRNILVESPVRPELCISDTESSDSTPSSTLTHGLQEFLLGDSRSEPSLSASGCRSCLRRSPSCTTPRLFELAEAWFSNCKGFFCFRERVPRRGNPRPLQRRANGASEHSKNSCGPCVDLNDGVESDDSGASRFLWHNVVFQCVLAIRCDGALRALGGAGRA